MADRNGIPEAQQDLLSPFSPFSNPVTALVPGVVTFPAQNDSVDLTALTVTFSTRPTTAGSLTAVVITAGVSSGAAVQVATVKPVVSSSTASLTAIAMRWWNW